jgi:excisionase family DNA binding protein
MDYCDTKQWLLIIMEQSEAAVVTKRKWYSIREAAEYLDVGEPTVYRWMREGKITYRKVGDSTRFWQEDLDSVMQVFHSEKNLDKAREVCPICRHTELVEGKVRGAGLVYFVPQKTKFWTLKDSFVDTQALMCTRCGAISWFGETAKLATLRLQQPREDADKSTVISEQK